MSRWITGIFKPASAVKSRLCLSHVYRVKDISAGVHMHTLCASDAPQIDNKTPGTLHIVAMDPIRRAVQLDEEKY